MSRAIFLVDFLGLKGLTYTQVNAVLASNVGTVSPSSFLDGANSDSPTHN